MIRNENIICVSSIDWDFVWQGHQEIMSTFVKNGNTVLYIENTGIRAPNLKDIGRLKSRIINWRKGLRGIREESKNLFICSPLMLPFPYSRIAKLINRFFLLNNIKAWMKATGFKNPIIWTFLPTSVRMDLIENIDNSLVVYYCIAEFTELADSSRKVHRAEAELLQACDVVFAQGEKIKERCQKYNKNVYIFPFGVKSDIFLKPADKGSAPSDIKGIRKPILGYIGGVHKHIDFKLLRTLADKNPQASVVLVGPVQAEEAGILKNAKNVYLLGQKDHSELPFYIDAFDVCLIPYSITEYTKTVYPTKLNEYLMRGKRVLSTPLPEVVRFNEKFDDVVSISDSGEDFIKKAGRLLETPEEPDFPEKLVKIAGLNSWGKRIEEMSSILEAALYKRHKENMRGWKESLIRMTKIAQKKLIAISVACALFYLILFHTPLIWWIGKPLKVSNPVSRSDVIVVLGGGVGETGRPGQGYEERVKYAAELYQSGYAHKIIFSSGFVYALKETDVMKALAVSLGVNPEDIILEKNARNTYENAKYTLSIAKDNGYKRIIFISSPYHMLRLRLVAEKISPSGNNLIFSPIPQSIFYGDEKHVSLKHIKAIFREYLGIFYYLFKGYA